MPQAQTAHFCANDYLNAHASFISPAREGQIWEFRDLAAVERARKELARFVSEIRAYNWCPVQQPKGPVSQVNGSSRRPRVIVSFR